MSAKVRTCLWFESGGGEAAKFYTSLIPGSSLETPEAQLDGAMMVNFTLAGAPYQILNGGPNYAQTPAASISVATEDQDETDRLWDALLAGGGRESRCGWLYDRFGVSWQIVPKQLGTFLGGEDRDGAKRATEAMLAMNKLDIHAIEAAYTGS